MISTVLLKLMSFCLVLALFARALDGLNIKDLVSNVGSGAGAAPAAAVGAAPAPAAGGAAPAPKGESCLSFVVKKLWVRS